MRINELVLYNEPGSVEGHIPFVIPETVKKVSMINGIYVGMKQATMPIITLWNEDPRKESASLEMIGAVLLDKLDNGFAQLQTPTIIPGYRGKGFGIVFYYYVLDVLKMNVQSDQIQTPGSALIWTLLGRTSKYKVVGITKDGKEVPVIADGKRLFMGDQTVYDSQDIEVLRCYRKK